MRIYRLIVVYAWLAAVGVGSGYAQGAGRILFEGRGYGSVQEVHAEAGVAWAHSGGGSGVGCVPILTATDAARGYYDDANMRFVCHRDGGGVQAQLEANEAVLRAAGVGAGSGVHPPVSGGVSANRYRFSDANRSTPYHNAGYNGPMNDVCQSNFRENMRPHWRARSFWKVGYGATVFMYLHYPGMYWVMDYSAWRTPVELRGHAMRYYQWCVSFHGGRCY